MNSLVTVNYKKCVKAQTQELIEGNKSKPQNAQFFKVNLKIFFNDLYSFDILYLKK